jgi:hypothetical protein
MHLRHPIPEVASGQRGKKNVKSTKDHRALSSVYEEEPLRKSWRQSHQIQIQ